MSQLFLSVGLRGVAWVVTAGEPSNLLPRILDSGLLVSNLIIYMPHITDSSQSRARDCPSDHR